MKSKLREIFSIPNILTYIRLILIPFFVWAYVTAVKPQDYFIAAALLLLSGLTDVADGFIARHFHMITEWGKAIDPIADKLTQAAIAFCLVFRYPWMWLLLGLFIVKELYMGITSLVLLKKGKRLNGAMWFGKVSTAVFYLVMIILIAYPPMPPVAAYIMMTVSGFFLLLSFLLYIPQYNNLFREYREEQELLEQPQEPKGNA
ncbi:MAG: CDP-alcohol phosphatidyltransferase family protein [Oscillospiraceae bacterium]